MKASRSVVLSAGPAENISGSIESNGVFKWTLEAVSGDLADAVTDDNDSDKNDSNGSSSRVSMTDNDAYILNMPKSSFRRKQTYQNF